MSSPRLGWVVDRVGHRTDSCMEAARGIGDAGSGPGGGTAATTQMMMMWVLALDSTGMQSTESGVAHQGVVAGAKGYGRDAGRGCI